MILLNISRPSSQHSLNTHPPTSQHSMERFSLHWVMWARFDAENTSFPHQNEPTLTRCHTGGKMMGGGVWPLFPATKMVCFSLYILLTHILPLKACICRLKPPAIVVRVIHARKHIFFRVRHLSTSAEHESHPWQTVFMHGGLICMKTILIGCWADTTSRVPNPSILYFLKWFVVVIFRIFIIIIYYGKQDWTACLFKFAGKARLDWWSISIRPSAKVQLR